MTPCLVSVIIPCFNHGHYLGRAIESVLSQSHKEVEIIVVDDGSTDNTCQVARSYEGVDYVHRENRGLPASRNAGIRHSKGSYLVFLDADDWLLPHALETNLAYLQQHKDAAFVSGGYIRLNHEDNTCEEIIQEVKETHFQKLLTGNYIGMIAAVLFNRWVFHEFLYDESLKACEDYDLYLRISRKYPVVHHSIKIAAYFIYSSNMSSNEKLMLSSVLKVLSRPVLVNSVERSALEKGKANWRKYYCNLLFQKVTNRRLSLDLKNLLFLFKHQPMKTVKFMTSGRINQ